MPASSDIEFRPETQTLYCWSCHVERPVSRKELRDPETLLNAKQAFASKHTDCKPANAYRTKKAMRSTGVRTTDARPLLRDTQERARRTTAGAPAAEVVTV